MGNNKSYNQKKRKNNKFWEKEKKQREVRQTIQDMSNYTFTTANVKGTSGKSIIGANVNVASDNFDKTLQYIYGKIGLKVNGSNHIAVLEKMLDAYKKKKEWDEAHPGEKKPGKESQYLLSHEQNEKMKTLLFHHFSVLAPILGSMENEEIAKIHDEIDNETNKTLTEEKANEIN